MKLLPEKLRVADLSSASVKACSPDCASVRDRSSSDSERSRPVALRIRRTDFFCTTTAAFFGPSAPASASASPPKKQRSILLITAATSDDDVARADNLISSFSPAERRSRSRRRSVECGGLVG
uniref:Uncharacterized protein n=1 Tax=Oryza brachyantha TaxID=4533 RepID=J3LHM5_ORYBR